MDTLFDSKAFERETNRTLKEMFKSKINGSFLIKIKSETLHKIGIELLEHYPMQFRQETLVSGRDETPEYDICRIIIGTHHHHSIFLSEEEIRKNQSSSAYQEQLVNEVIEKIRLHQIGSAFFRKQQLLLGDEFLYFPVPYELFAMCIRSLFLITDCKEPMLTKYAGIINLALSALTLMENNFLGNAYPLCRGMIELFLKTLMLKEHPDILDDFERFCKFEIRQTCCEQTYPDDFESRYKSRILTNVSKVDFLHFGWLDSIKDYNTKNRNRYSIYGILEYLLKTGDESQKKKLECLKRLYKMCHGYTHCSVIGSIYPLLHYFELSIMLYHVIRTIFNDIHTVLKQEFLPEDKNLLDILDRDFALLNKQHDNRSTENFESYYHTRF